MGLPWTTWSLKKSVADRFSDWPQDKQGRLAGAVVNSLFGTEAVDPEVGIFARNHREIVEEELRCLADQCSDLIPFLTDSLPRK